MGETGLRQYWRASERANLHDDLFISAESDLRLLQEYEIHMTERQLSNDNLFIFESGRFHNFRFVISSFLLEFYKYALISTYATSAR
jgi:hypothetical protein